MTKADVEWLNENERDIRGLWAIKDPFGDLDRLKYNRKNFLQARGVDPNSDAFLAAANRRFFQSEL